MDIQPSKGTQTVAPIPRFLNSFIFVSTRVIHFSFVCVQVSSLFFSPGCFAASCHFPSLVHPRVPESRDRSRADLPHGCAAATAQLARAPGVEPVELVRWSSFGLAVVGKERPFALPPPNKQNSRESLGTFVGGFEDSLWWVEGFNPKVVENFDRFPRTILVWSSKPIKELTAGHEGPV